MASGSEDSGSDIDGEILTDDEDVSSDDDDLQFPEGGRGPWIPVFDQQNYVRDHIYDFITDGPVGPINRNIINPQPIDYFENQLSNGETSLFELLTNETNRYAAQFFQQHPVQNLPPNSRSRQWIDVTLAEMRTFIGLLLLMGIIQKPSIESYWSTDCLLSTPSFANAMSRNRFQLILKFLHANNNEQNPARDHPNYDPAGKLTEMVNLCNQGFSRNYRLARDITVDERMVGFKGRHHMVQYMANKKAHRWGIKLWTLSESDTGYTHQIVVYKGRQPQNLVQYPNGLGYHTVMNLVQPHLEKHHHVTFDSFFTSPKLCHDLFNMNTYSTGTVCVRRRGMPRSYRNLKLPKGSTKVLIQGPLIAVHWSDRRAVNLLSTLALPRMENHANSRGQESEVPHVVSLYNRTMGGVDLGDQLISEYTPDIRSLKMWKKVLINLLATAEERVAGGRRKKCRVCDARVRTWCPTCMVGLCLGHFRRYHSVVHYEE
ncbi:Hypothetical predicted protein [Mytilus galloprovincialis]|uniref:PiggyBac transposable element-derived protein domain-containing protein n=1 Tax=Mytilus galloprovincialis TaxID=29158 RepID=A0A8B6ED97_MYTGA|nr:Hypothetical predicted protein [Mytilus galloprovincialis]